MQQRSLLTLLALVIGLVNGYPNNDKPPGYVKGIKELSRAPRDTPCPDAVAIAPCVCWESFDAGIELDCSEVESEAQLEAVFQETFFPVKTFGSFFLTNNKNISRLGNILNGVTFENVQVENTNVAFVSEYFLIDSQFNLHTLWIQNSLILTEAFPFLTLSNYEKLSNLAIGDSELTYVPLLQSDSLQHAMFGGNNIDSIEPGIFSQVSTLQTIDLRNNKLSFLESGSFQMRNGFNELLLMNNSIATMQAGVFTMPQDRDALQLHLLMNDNQMTQLSEDVFGDVFPNITSFAISNNPLLCGCDLEWIATNPEYLEKLDVQAKCVDGTLLVDLTSGHFADCP